jgi:hypothetical protein
MVAAWRLMMCIEYIEKPCIDGFVTTYCDVVCCVYDNSVAYVCGIPECESATCWEICLYGGESPRLEAYRLWQAMGPDTPVVGPWQTGPAPKNKDILAFSGEPSSPHLSNVEPPRTVRWYHGYEDAPSGWYEINRFPTHLITPKWWMDIPPIKG